MTIRENDVAPNTMYFQLFIFNKFGALTVVYIAANFYEIIFIEIHFILKRILFLIKNFFNKK